MPQNAVKLVESSSMITQLYSKSCISPFITTKCRFNFVQPQSARSAVHKWLCPPIFQCCVTWKYQEWPEDEATLHYIENREWPKDEASAQVSVEKL